MRILAAVFLVVALVAAPSRAEPPEGLTYEVLINGESFLVEANRMERLESTQAPGTVYEVAIRVAQQQRLTLNTIRFTYDAGFSVDDDRQADIRTATLNHELGFSMLITDVGGALDEKWAGELLTTLAESMQQQVQAEDALEIEVSKPVRKTFGGASGAGVTITYGDQQGFGHTCLVYVLGDKESSASVIVHYLDAEADNVLPLVKQVLDSLEQRES